MSDVITPGTEITCQSSDATAGSLVFQSGIKSLTHKVQFFSQD